MIDISKCMGTGCKKKERCYRYTAVSTHPMYQSIIIPKIRKDGYCDMYWKDINYRSAKVSKIKGKK